MKDFFKFSSDKSYVHEVTYLTDAKYYLKNHKHAKVTSLLNSIKTNNWYDSRGKNVTKEVRQLFKDNKHKPVVLLHKIRMALNK